MTNSSLNLKTSIPLHRITKIELPTDSS